jgi:putative tryptophan/tyrosine transport system substrate-binding protein
LEARGYVEGRTVVIAERQARGQLERLGGLIESLARPGGNVTGLAYSVGPEIFAKDLALLRELVPEVRKVAVLSGPMRGVNYSLMLQNVGRAAQAMGLELSMIEAKTLPEDFEPAFTGMGNASVQALLVFGDPAG